MDCDELGGSQGLGIEENISKVRERIFKARLRSPYRQDVTLVAVSKTASLREIEEAMRCGITDFGENRVQQLLTRWQMFPHARWHLVGRLQSNKVKDVIGRVVLIHSLDRWELAEYIEKRAEKQGLVVEALLQVNVSQESTKAGVEPDAVRDFLLEAGRLRNLKIVGLMTMAPEVEDPEEIRPIFKKLKRLFDEIKREGIPGVEMRFLSMGMTQDYEVAIEEGANMVRIGRALFGHSGRQGG